jgi:KDO2-lipid IV(A) lauroyltransferase
MNDLSVKFCRGLLVAFSKLPLKVHYWFAGIFTWFIKRVMKYRADVILVNLAKSFPEKKYWDLRDIWNEYYDHLGEIIAEAVWFSGSSYSRLRANGIVKIVNPEVVSEAYDNSPSVTILSTHCGNWEILGGLLGYETLSGKKFSFGEKDITVVYKKLKNNVSDRVFALNRIAPLEEVGVECEVESMNILRYAIKNKGEKRVYIYPTDQSPYRQASAHPIGVFMNQETNAMLGSAILASKLSHAVVYMKMKRVRKGYYEMSFVPICSDASKVKPEDIMRKYYDLLEEEINETPCNWLWSHKRWK